MPFLSRQVIDCIIFWACFTGNCSGKTFQKLEFATNFAKVRNLQLAPLCAFALDHLHLFSILINGNFASVAIVYPCVGNDHLDHFDHPFVSAMIISASNLFQSSSLKSASAVWPRDRTIGTLLPDLERMVMMVMVIWWFGDLVVMVMMVVMREDHTSRETGNMWIPTRFSHLQLSIAMHWLVMMVLMMMILMMRRMMVMVIFPPPALRCFPALPVVASFLSLSPSKGRQTEIIGNICTCLLASKISYI